MAKKFSSLSAGKSQTWAHPNYGIAGTRVAERLGHPLWPGFGENNNSAAAVGRSPPKLKLKKKKKKLMHKRKRIRLVEPLQPKSNLQG